MFSNIKKIVYSGDYEEVPAVEVKLGGYFSNFTEQTLLHDEDYTQDRLISKITYAGVFDRSIGVVGSYLQRRKNTGVTHLCINATENSPFLVLEEKILQIHIKEITWVASLLLSLFSQEETKKCIMLSNFLLNRVHGAKHLRTAATEYNIKIKTSGLSAHKYIVSDAILATEDDVNAIVTNNILADFLYKRKKYGDVLEFDSYIDDTVLTFYPSTLLAIYETLVYKKPVIETYIQLITDIKSIVIKKVPYGIPLLYLLHSINQDWEEKPRHCFMGRFSNRKIITNFGLPVTKHTPYYWFLSDNSFTKVFNTLKSWRGPGEG